MNFYDELIENSCKRVKVDYKIHAPIGMHTKISKNLDKALNKGRLASVYFDQKVFGNTFYPKKVPSANHFATVLGRKFNNSSGKCEYLVKNSYSESWRDKGFSWISEEDFVRRSLQVIYLSNK